MHYFGIFLGWVLVAGFLFEALKYLVRIINRKKMGKYPAGSPQRKNFNAFMGFVIKPHQYVPLYLITILLLHFMIEVVHEGFVLTGILAACLMVTQVALGAYGTMVKNKEKGLWLSAHRVIAVMLIVVIAWHIVMVWGLPAD